MATKPNFFIVTGNTAPGYAITCTRNKVAIDLTEATTVALIIQRKSDKVITQVGNNAIITTAASGLITYTAESTDFPTKGLYVGDIEVTYNDGGIERLYNQAIWSVRASIN